jgi:LuxR family maltose regulon positive regulatory protein
MALASLLATKLYAPPVLGAAIRRPRLVQRIEEGLAGRVTLISAPAGFGKTTLAAEWRDRTRVPVAWLSLEEDDREPLRFLAYVVAALQTVEPSLGERSARMLRSPQPPPAAAVAAELVNELAAGTTRLALVLDPYHVVDEGPLRDVMAFLIDHVPARLHLILTTREEPALPVARLRARGQLTELRADDLRFEGDEATAFFRDAMGIELADEDVAALGRRTEGWVAGLQLAALSLRGRDDVSGFVRSFAGGHRHVVDYLADEVLRALPAAVRDFLLTTSVLDRLSAPLCDAVTGRSDGAATLAELERANLFLVPLDDERRWFRYHSLFLGVLRAEAGRERALDAAELHRRASAWFEAEGSPGDAIRNAAAAGDTARGATLLERAWRVMDRTFQVPTWHAWSRHLPEEALRARPVLAVAIAWALLGEGELAAAERWLQPADAWLAAREAEDPASARSAHERDVADEAAFRALPARIAAARSYAAAATGEVAAGEAFARRAVDVAPDDDPGARALPAGLLGLAHWRRGELDEALEALQMGATAFRDLGDAAAALSFTFAVADVLVAQGRLREARRAYEEALAYADAHDGPPVPGTAELHVGLAELSAERGDLGAAEEHLRTAEALGDGAVLTGDAGRLAAARARVEVALGDAAAALAALDEADRLQVAGPVPDIRPTAATRARVRLAQGRLTEARAWAESEGALAEADASYLNEYALLTLVRVHLATYRSEGSEAPIETAQALLDAIVEAAEAGARTGTVIEARVLQALVRQAAGEEDLGVAVLVEALRSARTEGHHAVFTAEGPAMARMLRAAVRGGADRGQVRRLLDALKGSSERPRIQPDVVEPLSDRERDVLRLLRSEASGPQVARELGMSVHTLRSHTKSIYAKLGVHGRREAVLRADELNLV